jgi:hypothetical protein
MTYDTGTEMLLAETGVVSRFEGAPPAGAPT